MSALAAADRLFAPADADRARGPWRTALAVSLALHAAGAGAILARPVDTSPAAEAIDVEIVSAEPVAQAADIPADIPTEPATAEAPPAAPEATAGAERREKQEEPEKSDEGQAQAPQTTPEPREAAPPTAAGAPAAAAAAAEAEAEERRAAMRAYASAVSAELNRRRLYPAAARARGIVGVARVAFSMDASGRVARFDIVSSTGQPILDDSIRKIMEKVRTPPPPGGAFEGVVTIRFGLR